MDVCVRRVPEFPCQFAYQPYGESDWIALPAPIITHTTSEACGVTFHCADGRVYHLFGDPSNPLGTWRIHEVWRR